MNPRRETRYTHRSDRRTYNQDLIEANREKNYLKLLVIGDSMIRFLPLMEALSIAMSGATIEYLTRKFQTDFQVRNTDYDAIVILIGTNNIERSMEGIREKIDDMLTTLSDTFRSQLKLILGIRHRPKDTNWDLKTENGLTTNRRTINTLLSDMTANRQDYQYRHPYKIETKMTVDRNGQMTRQYDDTLYQRDGLHFNQKGMERLALGLSTIIYDDIRDRILDHRRHMTEHPRLINWTGIYSNPRIRHIGNRIYFKGKDSLLSNFREHPLQIFSHTFTTAEAAYQWIKAKTLKKHGLADQILRSRTGIEAKRLADTRISEQEQHQWTTGLSIPIMRFIQTQRSQQDYHFRTFLKNNNDFRYIEDTSNDLWARGRYNMGTNQLGKIMTELARDLDRNVDIQQQAMEQQLINKI